MKALLFIYVFIIIRLYRNPFSQLRFRLFFPASFLSISRMNKKKLPFNSQKDRNIRQDLKSPIDIDINRFLFFFECFFLILTKMPGKKTFQVIILNHCYWLKLYVFVGNDGKIAFLLIRMTNSAKKVNAKNTWMFSNQRNKTAKIALMDYICTNAHSLISFWLPCAAAANLCVIFLLTNTDWIQECENVWFLSQQKVEWLSAFS